jgi:hypothetical protein
MMRLSLQARSILIRLGLTTLLALSVRDVFSYEQRSPQQIQPHAWIKEEGTEELLFDFFQSETKSSDTMLRETRFVDRQTGEDAFREKILTDLRGLQLLRYDVEQLQIDEKGSIEVDRTNNKIHFKYYKLKKWRDATEKLEEPFLVGGMLPDFLHAHRANINTKSKVSFRLAVPYMTKSFDFYFQEEKDKINLDQKEFLSFKMAPKHLLVSAVVKPLYFLIPPQSQKVERILGRVFLKKRVGESWESFQAETRFLDVQSASVANKD